MGRMENFVLPRMAVFGCMSVYIYLDIFLPHSHIRRLHGRFYGLNLKEIVVVKISRKLTITYDRFGNGRLR